MDGSAFYTLPVIEDLSTGKVVGDSFDIALYLDKVCPEGPTLIPDATIGLQAAFSVQVDAIFTQHTLLALHGMPLNPANADVSKAGFGRRAGKDWDDLTVRGEERKKSLESFKAALEELAVSYRQKDGVFLDGDRPSYADLIVGGWLQFFKVTMKEWEEVESWHDGLWKELHLALQKCAEVK